MFVQSVYQLLNWHVCYSLIELGAGDLFAFWILIPYQTCDVQMFYEGIRVLAGW